MAPSLRPLPAGAAISGTGLAFCGFWGLDRALRGSHLDQRSGWFKASVWWRWDSFTPGRGSGGRWEGKKGCQV